MGGGEEEKSQACGGGPYSRKEQARSKMKGGLREQGPGGGFVCCKDLARKRGLKIVQIEIERLELQPTAFSKLCSTLTLKLSTKLALPIMFLIHL